MTTEFRYRSTQLFSSLGPVLQRLCANGLQKEHSLAVQQKNVGFFILLFVLFISSQPTLM